MPMMLSDQSNSRLEVNVYPNTVYVDAIEVDVTADVVDAEDNENRPGEPEVRVQLWAPAPRPDVHLWMDVNTARAIRDQLGEALERWERRS